MMSCFYHLDTSWQISMLVLSQLTIITLAGGSVLLFRHKGAMGKLIAMLALLLMNTAEYVFIQLDSRITGASQGMHLHIPWVILLVFTLTSLSFGLFATLSETRNRKTIDQSSIKDAFDNMPTGVCYFNEAGLPVLCNLAMHRFSFAICGEDVQQITDLEKCLAEEFMPIAGTRKDGKLFFLSDGSVWHLEKGSIAQKDGTFCTKFVATDVTDLQKMRVELKEETDQLRKVQLGLNQLAANVAVATREEEILNTKMRVHDEMGRCLVAARKHLCEGDPVPDQVVVSWKRAISMLKYNIETVEEDMLSQIRKTCQIVNLRFVQTGELPKEESAAYLLTCGIRECVTNAVRYAGADELYAAFSETETEAKVTVTNNGSPPEGPIVEGGGLSTLRRRVERAGGTMLVEATPRFRLTVTVRKQKEGLL